MPQCPSCKQEVSLDHERCPSCGALLGRNELENELRALLGQGQKIEAIRLYRQRTGAGLREAKDAVEDLERGAARPRQDRLNPNLEQDLLVLLEKGRKIEAIKLYRDQTGVDLKEAKETIEALAAQFGLTKVRAGCFGMFALMVVFVAALGALHVL